MDKRVVVYESEWLIRRIYEVSDRIRNDVTDQTLFEERAIERISGYINQSEDNIKNRRYIERLINEVASSVIDRNKNECYSFFGDMVAINEEGDEVEYEPEDVLADVEGIIATKETAALLAQDDCRKKKIIELWTIGNTNSATISRTLAGSFGGNEETHRKFIQRFRQSCRERLFAVI